MFPDSENKCHYQSFIDLYIDNRSHHPLIYMSKIYALIMPINRNEHIFSNKIVTMNHILAALILLYFLKVTH